MPELTELLRFRDRARAELSPTRFDQVAGLPQRQLEALAESRIPREGLERAHDEGIEHDDADGDGLTIEGYGAVTNQVTEIDSWEGTFEEEFLSGSFKRTARNRVPKMQFDHGYSTLLGSVPLGRWDAAEEDDHGLHLGPGKVFDNLFTLPIRQAIIAKEIPGQSIRFSVLREEWIDNAGVVIKDERELFDLIFWGHGLDERGPIRRRIKEARVSEAGPVVWPAYEGTSVGLRGAVRLQPGDLLDRPLTGVITIDLGRLHEPTQLEQLARAVYLADTRSARRPSGSTTRTTSATSPPTDRPSGTEPPAQRAATATAPSPGSTSAGTPRPVRSAAAMRSAISRRRQIVEQLTEQRK